METEIEEIIKQQLEYLPKEIVDLFTNPKLSDKIFEIGKENKINIEQLDIFQTETFLLILGLTNSDEYEEELRNKLNINKETIDNIKKGIYSFISNETLEKIKEIYKQTTNEIFEGGDPDIDKPLILDPRFENAPQETQKAIAKSGWKERLYSIAPIYKLNVEQMGILEETTIKVILGEIHPDKYEDELASKITIPKEDVANLVIDINEKIFKVIRGVEKKYWDKEKTITNEDEIPLPPYAKIINNEDEIPLPPPSIKLDTKIIEKTELIQPIIGITNTPQNIIEEKLKGVTVSDHTVSDHSLPKMNDPYRETI
ncbi:MAG: hypothetical protein WC908_02370 [Candidatus Paceibacterota bacterium]